jgi:anhydro-N-acetylmuramic acid kinase
MAQPPRPARSDRKPADAAGTNDERLIAGAMSGTSADGVDVAIVAIAGRGLAMTARLLNHHHRPYEAALRQALFKVRETGSTELATLARIGRQISLAYSRAVADALASASLVSSDLACVAAHGQTLYHAPPDTIQWLDPALVAAEVGCTVVSDFRRADCAAGGQGAPLVPFADYVLFRHSTKNRVLLNIGGIANVTWLSAGADLDRVVAFDTGPGNCVCDYLMRQYGPPGPGLEVGYDLGGAIAGKGIAIPALVEAVLADPYFAQPPPKSTDGPAMIALGEAAYRDAGRRFPFENLMRTACQITAATIRRGFQWLPGQPVQVIVSGGGAKNPVLTELVREAVAPAEVFTTDDLGVSGASKEALAFALLAAATLDGVPSNVPSATGARRGVVLGSITPNPLSSSN